MDTDVFSRQERRTIESGNGQSSIPASEFKQNPNLKPGVVSAESPEDIDYEVAKPRALTAADLSKLNQEKTFPMTLYQTSINLGEMVSADVRIINITDRHISDQMVPAVREKINKLFFSAGRQRGGRQNADPLRVQKEQARIEDVTRVYGIACFVNPRLVLDQADEDVENGVWWVDRVSRHDLHELVRICEGDQELAARRLEGFSL